MKRKTDNRHAPNRPTREESGRTARSIDTPYSAPNFRTRRFPLGEGCFTRLPMRAAD